MTIDTRFAVMRKIVLLLAVSAAGDAFSALTSRSYVQEGLLVHWDGIENTGVGLAHDNSATVWKDLSGNGLDMTIPEGASFGDKGLNVLRETGSDVANGKIPGKDAAIGQALKDARYTVDLVYDMRKSYHKERVFMICLGNTSTFIGAYNSDYENRIGFTPNYGRNGTAPTVFVNVGDVDKTGLQNLVCRQDGHDVSVRLYSASGDRAYEKTAKQEVVDPDINTAWKFKFNRAYEINCGLNGVYHSVRLYDRALSGDEVAVNHAVDRIRYFGAQASSLVLPDGWKFESDGADVRLYRRISVLAVDVAGQEAAGGSISVGESAAQAEAFLWCEQGSSLAVSLKAAAAEGYVFCGWLGVPEDKKYSSEISAEINGDVKAVFRKIGAQVLLKWTGSELGDWNDAANWRDEFGFIPMNGPSQGGSVVIPASVTATVPETTPMYASVLVEGSLVLTNWTTALRAESVTVAAGGTITCGAPATDMDSMSRVWIQCGDFTVESGGTVTVSEKGYFGWPKSGGLAAGGKYTCGWGPGAAPPGNTDFSKLLAPSHGGYGGRMLHVEHWLPNILPYDDPAAPELPGSSGGSNEYGHGGHGGGAVKIEATGAVVVDGSILANGRNCLSYGGKGETSNHGQPGSGGSIYIICKTFAGSGEIRADGGGGDNPKLQASVPAMSAGGGMIAIHYDADEQSAGAVSGMRISAAAGHYKTTAYTTTCYDADTNHWEADIGTLHFTDGKILDDVLGSGLTGQIRGLKSYSRGGPLDFTDGHVRFAEEGVAVTIAGDLTIGGERTARLEIGGATATNRSAFVDLWAGTIPCSLSVRGNLTLEGASRMDVRSAAAGGDGDFGALVKVAGTMTVGSNCIVTAISDLDTLVSPKFEVGSLTVSTGGVFTASGRGGRGGYAIYNYEIDKPVTYGNGAGPGRGNGYSGASHGGIGGANGAKAVYGDPKRPVAAGSGGSAGALRVIGGAGGGLVYVSATNGNIVIDGEVSADGLDGIKMPFAVSSSWGYGSGGSGGSILLEAKTFRLGETGLLSACGGDTTPIATINSGSGGGGRIAVWCGSPWEADLRRSRRVDSAFPLSGAEVDGWFAWEGTCQVSAGEATGDNVVTEPAAGKAKSSGEDGTTWFGFVRDKPLGFWMLVR